MARAKLKPGKWGKISTSSKEGSGWHVSKVNYCDARTGKVRQITRGGETKGEVLENLNAVLTGTDIKKALGTSVKIGALDTVSKLAELMMRRKRAEKKAGPQSMARYESTMRNHILNKETGLGELAVGDLEIPVVDAFLMELAEKAPSEADRARILLSAMLKLAVGHQAVPVNFMPSAFVPPAREYEILILTMPQIDRMLGAVDAWNTAPGRRGPRPDGRLGRVLRIALGSGLRIGEVGALRRRDVKRPQGEGAPWTLTVQGTIIEPDKGSIFRQAHPKTESSVRTVPISNFAAAVIEQLMEETADGGPDHLLLTTRTGGIVGPANLRRSWRRIRGTGDVEDLNQITPHALRRTVGTILAAEVSPEYAAKYLGHGHGTAVLYAHYVKYINTVDDTGAGALNNLMPKAITA
ncbi:site-specific integrase [Cryobacterium sp. CG_9.6]|uniref:tyrosine-type recombinase/integrase n=1 Tax=Cryobacterium sp. CG_9.6 TaxID=2760710 RepID=UPI002476BC85|nr:site-specific integrase [Cryobacterium sp. CG_9.6]MDH6236262.1 integrase [Cryobacterium sp. CG_9.6]